MPAHKDGPYLLSALICDGVQSQPDGTLNIFRVTDGITIAPNNPKAPAQMPKIELNLVILVTFVGGIVSGTHSIALIPQKPSGEKFPASRANLNFLGGHSKTFTAMKVSLPIREQGVYWFDIYFDDELETRIPYSITYKR